MSLAASLRSLPLIENSRIPKASRANSFTICTGKQPLGAEYRPDVVSVDLSQRQAGRLQAKVEVNLGRK